jgi:hypothetical protein
VGTLLVVDVDEAVDLGLELGRVAAAGFLRSHFFKVRW